MFYCSNLAINGCLLITSPYKYHRWFKRDCVVLVPKLRTFLWNDENSCHNYIKCYYFYHICQTWILARDIGQCPGKNRVTSDEGCFTTDTVVRREVKFFFISYRLLKTQNHSVRIGLYCFAFFINIFVDNLLMQFFHVPNRKMCLSKKTFYQYCFLPCLGQLLLWKRFVYLSLHSTINLMKIYTTPDSLN